MFSYWLLQGMLIGFAIALPVGPVGLLCIRNTLHRGLICGLVSGLGAATADSIYGAIAGLGLSAIGSFLVFYSTFLHFLGALFLCFLGIVTYRAKPPQLVKEDQAKGYGWLYFSTLLLTLSNPMTILSFVGVYAGFGIGGPETDWIHGLTLTLGVFVGSAIWWLILSSVTAIFHKAMTPQTSVWLNRISGSLLFAFGILVFVAIL